MSLRCFEGVAGSGKTTRLLRNVGERIASGVLRDEQRVLALTFMHGSRRRLDGRLREQPGLARRFDCLTIDGFARHLVRRWRSLAIAMWGQTCFEELDFERTRGQAVELLGRAEIAAWVARRYPLTLVDELQDCRASVTGPRPIFAARSSRSS